MVTCHVRYLIDPTKLTQFEHYASRWIPLVQRFGGQHHGSFLPSEGENNVALVLFSFPFLALYEQYRLALATDVDCLAAIACAAEHGLITSYERSFFRLLLN
jgi:hypothetical protein